MIYDAIESQQTVRFFYNGTERIVDPYVFGLSSSGNPLLRGYQLRGDSLSGKGPGWRVFQAEKIGGIRLEGIFFSPFWAEYDPLMTWIFEPKIGVR